MQRELSYQVPFDRLIRVARSAWRKAYPTTRLQTWLPLPVALVVSCMIVYGEQLRGWLDTPFALELLFIGVVLVILAARWRLRRYQISQLKRRVDDNQMVRMTQDDGGLRFVMANIEHYLKWSGISQMLLEPDGVVVSHGNLLFFIPDKAFTDAGDRLAFIRDVYGRLNERARLISEPHMGAVLNEHAQRPAA